MDEDKLIPGHGSRTEESTGFFILTLKKYKGIFGKELKLAIGPLCKNYSQKRNIQKHLLGCRWNCKYRTTVSTLGEKMGHQDFLQEFYIERVYWSTLIFFQWTSSE